MTLEVKTPGKVVTEVLVLIVIEEKERIGVPRKVAARWMSVSIIALLSKLLALFKLLGSASFHWRILEHVGAATPNSRQ